MNSDLFGGADHWLHSPTKAFEALLNSAEFVLAGRPKRTNPGVRIREASANVYRAQWKKFETWLAERNMRFHEASRQDIERFLFQGLGARGVGGTAEATRQRYASLLERAYGQAVKVGAIELSPVPPELLRSVATKGRAAMPVGATPETIEKLLVFLASFVRDRQKEEPLDAWRPMRDAVMAIVGLSGGLRCKELAHLRRSQLRREGNGNLELSFANANTTSTALKHSVMLGPLATEVLATWVSFRFGALLAAASSSKRQQDGTCLPANDKPPIFPSGLNPNRSMLLSDDAINQNFKTLAKQAVMAGVLDEDNQWILSTGARGLRRARIVLDIKTDKDPQLMRHELGFWSTRSVARYQEELANAEDACSG